MGGSFNGLTFNKFLVNVNIFHSCWYSLNLFVSCYDILMFNVQSGKIQFSHFEGGRSTTRMLIRSVKPFDRHFFASIVSALHVILHFRWLRNFLRLFCYHSSFVIFWDNDPRRHLQGVWFRSLCVLSLYLPLCKFN